MTLLGQCPSNSRAREWYRAKGPWFRLPDINTPWCLVSAANGCICLPNDSAVNKTRSMASHPKPPESFRSPEQQATLCLLRTADAVKRRFARVIEPHGITTQQYNVLRILRGAGPVGLPTLTIGERMIEQTPGTTRLVDRLERKGLVTRTPCPTDRRRVFCRITDKGLDLLKELDEPVNQCEALAVSVLQADDLSSLIVLLDSVRSVNL